MQFQSRGAFTTKASSVHGEDAQWTVFVTSAVPEWDIHSYTQPQAGRESSASLCMQV